MRRIVLHVGNPKTGTTSLQQFFFDNRAALLEQGILYPVSESQPRKSHFNMVWEHAKNRIHDALGVTFASVEATARTSEWDTLLISSEYFEQTSRNKKISDALATLIGRFDLSLTVVAFVRPQHIWINSAYCQATKTFQKRLPFTEYLRRTIDNPRYDYCESMKIWTEWPNAEFVARPFSGRYAKPDLETYFADAAGLDNKMASILANSPKQARNITPGPYEVEISRRLARRMGKNSAWPANAKGRLRDFIGQSIRLHGWDAAPFNGVDNKLRGEIDKRFGGSNEAFARRNWGKSWNSLFEEEYARDLIVNDLVQTGISQADETAIAGIVEAAAGLLDASPA